MVFDEYCMSSPVVKFGATEFVNRYLSLFGLTVNDLKKKFKVKPARKIGEWQVSEIRKVIAYKLTYDYNMKSHTVARFCGSVNRSSISTMIQQARNHLQANDQKFMYYFTRINEVI